MIALLVAASAASGLVEVLIGLSPRYEAILWTVWQQGRSIGLLVGAYLALLVARMCVPGSPWSRAMRLAAAARLAWGLVCEAAVNPFVAPGRLLFEIMSVEVEVALALDIAVALGLVHVVRTGGISRAAAGTAWVAVGLAAFGLIASERVFAVDSSGVLTIVLRSGAPGAIACALVLRRMKDELLPRRPASGEGRA